ncbi:hypothetical protein NC653_009348 [Populus alba x Populus x berolinensis]|uniref:Uncharacterized protein n=1 Tax=Populus alba x Populus x berolinensis TaxID=444605 RepID=A0AAD6R9Y5_9ROSI|nr:hypothetical protein NC653_009348 [Populus alba x Populus x berolinensis]
MDAFGGYFVDEKAVLVENIFLNFLKVMMVTIRFEPYLKNACRRFVMELSSTFISDDNPNKIKRANNSRNWETGVSTGVVTCTSAVLIWNVVALSRMLNSNSNILSQQSVPMRHVPMK